MLFRQIFVRLVVIHLIGIPLFYVSGAFFWAGLGNTVIVGLFSIFIYSYLVGTNKLKLAIAVLLPIPWSAYYCIGLTEQQTLEQLFLYSSFIAYYVGVLIALTIDTVMKKITKKQPELE